MKCFNFWPICCSMSARSRSETFRLAVSSRYSKSSRPRAADLRAKICPFSRQRVDGFQSLVELGFQSFHDAGINDILGGNGKNKGLESFGFRFKTESLVNGGKSQVSLGGDVEVNAGGSGFLMAWHTFCFGLLLVG